MNTFRLILLLARPAAGKSEIMDFLRNLPAEERMTQYHVGALKELDDFPMLWAWFEEDDILSRMGKPRLHSDENGYFLDNDLWNVLIERLNLEYEKATRDRSDNAAQTILMEFSRGSEHGGFAQAFNHLSQKVLQDAAILYIDVPWEESLRKNRKRFNPNKPDSILEHGLEDAKLERLYRESDWSELIKNSPDYLTIQGIQVPYVIFDNRDDVTSQKGVALADRLKLTLDHLFQLYSPRR